MIAHFADCVELFMRVYIAQGELAEAEKDFAHACLANPHAANAWFLRGYIAWKKHDARQTSTMLAAARNARGRDWKPSGSVLEGEVQRRMYSESTFLNVFEELWDGSVEPAHAYARLAGYLSHMR